MEFDHLKKKRSPPRETVRASNSARAFAFFGLGRCWRVIEGRDEKRRHARGIARAGATAAMREDAKTRTPRGYAACDRRRMPRRAVRIARRRDTREIWRTHLRQELVETEDEVFVSLENRLDTLDDSLGVDPVSLGGAGVKVSERHASRATDDLEDGLGRDSRRGARRETPDAAD